LVVWWRDILAAESNGQKILKYLQENLPYSYNSKTLYRVFKGKISQSSIKTELSRLVKKDKVQRESRGFYIAKVTADTLHYLENPPILLHGIMMSCETKQKLQNTIHGIPSQSYTNEALNWFDVMQFTKSTNDRFYRDLWVEDRKVTITFHLKGKIDIYINSSKHPVDYLSFQKLMDFINGFLSMWIPFDRKKIHLIQTGVAKDYKKLRLEGVSSVSMKTFTNAWARIYYKSDIGATRVEAHITTDVTLDRVFVWLQSIGHPVVNGNGHGEDIFKDVT